MHLNKELPLVSIITPSYNQADFLEETIRSVLEQDYPNIEYLVVDGGSTDASVDIIKKYSDRINWWISEPDKGQADALNKGMAHAKGDIVAWLNSDDIYRPGAIRSAVEILQQNPELGFVYSKLDSIDRIGELFNTISYRQYDLLDLLSFRIIGQPTVFMRREILQRAGPLDASYNYLLDHHLWLRMLQLAPIKYIPAVWAAARHHPSAKNVAQAARFGEEAFRILEWAKTQPALSEIVRKHSRTVRAGAHRLDARYLLDGGEPGSALRAYGRVLTTRPSFAFEHWHRMLFALLSLMGLGWLRPLVLYRKISNNRPILVTGPHRSGTTWVGRMLSVNGDVAYVSEPLNVWHRPGVFDAKVDHWYTYVCRDNEKEYLNSFKQTLKLNYHFWKEFRSLRSLKDVLRMIRDLTIFSFGRIGHRRVLLKDPFAVFSTPWFADRLNCDVVIVLRHPAAFVSSLKRLDWPFDFKDLLAQPLLMRDWLEPFRKEMEEVVKNPGDVIGQGSLLWRFICYATQKTKESHPNFHVVRHEDLSLQPIKGFEKLYSRLELPYNSRVKTGILRATSSDNPQEISLDSIYATKLDSVANLENWKQRLTKEEIDRIRLLTEDVARIYYSDIDWN
jgi:glycosyltransferase involved in cell wall biosynthesis